MSTRLLVAALSSSAVIVAVIGIGLYLSAGTMLGWRNIPQGSFGHSMFFFFFFGWPIALVVTLTAGAAGVAFVERSSERLTLSSVVLPAALLGAVVAPLVWAVIWSESDLEGVGLLGAIGLVAGVIGGVCFWALMRPRVA